MKATIDENLQHEILAILGKAADTIQVVAAKMAWQQRELERLANQLRASQLRLAELWPTEGDESSEDELVNLGADLPFGGPLVSDSALLTANGGAR